MATINVDFSNAERSQFMPRHLPEGNYKGKITKAELVEAKSDREDMVLYTIEVRGAGYPYYCKLVPNQLWKLREILIAAGMKVPNKAVKVDPARIVGRTIGVSLEDDEYNGKLKSVITETFSVSELDEDGDKDDDLEDDDVADDDTDDATDEDEDEDEAEPVKKPAKKSAKKSAKKDADDDFLEFDDLD